MTLLEAHDETKRAIGVELKALADLAEELGMRSLRLDLLETQVPKLVEERFNLVVLGEFNHGKSTFVNALLGADVLPTGITPTTAALTHVVWAETPRASVVRSDGESPIPVPALADWVALEAGRAPEIRYVEVGYPANIVKSNVTLVDTPGVNDLNEQRAEITYGYVPRADAVIFLLDAGQVLKESERTFLASRVLERSRDRMIFVIGKADLLSETELVEVTEYVREHLNRLLDAPPIFAVSARRYLAGDSAQAGMAPLIAHLSRFLSEDRGRILLDNASGDGLATASYLKQNLSLKRRTLELSLDELEARVMRARAQVEATHESLAKIHTKIEAEAEAVKAQVRLDLERFVARFEEVLPSEIDRTDAGDVKRYLPLFIHDKVKEWAEAEGEVAAGLLERLAEEVIALASDNARSAAAALAGRLGPGDARVELDVDSFKYDLSIYAVGALGTTLFLFVNTLAGGLLTLAAPILAIVLHSKVAAEIKDSAKQKGPEAIHRAAQVIYPHFEKLIDDFGRKLDQFVTSAGDRLYRGISEVLEHAVAERRAQGEKVAPLAEQAGMQLQRLEQVEQQLTALRASLWA